MSSPFAALALQLTCFAVPTPACGTVETLYAPVWSPDGRWIAFDARVGARSLVGLVEVKSGVVRWPAGTEWNSRAPSWSPDGTELVFVAVRERERRLVSLPIGSTSGRATLIPSPFPRPSWPRWSPDGKSLAYVAGEPGSERLVVAGAHGEEARSVTPPEFAVSARITWSPDSRRIAFVARTQGGKDEDPARLYEIGRDGTNLLPVGPPAREFNPAWAPDGGAILVDGHHNGGWESDDGGWEVWARDATGEAGRRRLTDNTVNDWGASWSPDGRSIAFSRGMNDHYEIWVADADGSNARRLTYLVYRDRAPGEWPAARAPRFGPEFIDPRDGERYPTVEIGTQVWMARNLAHATPASWCYGDDAADCAVHGRLYTWNAAASACPPGWKLPSDDEWNQLEIAIGMPVEAARRDGARGSAEGASLRAGGDSGFGAPISGYRRPDGTSARRGERAAFWSATPNAQDDAWHRDIRSDVGTIYRSPVTRDYALSARCVQAESIPDRTSRGSS